MTGLFPRRSKNTLARGTTLGRKITRRISVCRQSHAGLGLDVLLPKAGKMPALRERTHTKRNFLPLTGIDNMVGAPFQCLEGWTLPHSRGDASSYDGRPLRLNAPTAISAMQREQNRAEIEKRSILCVPMNCASMKEFFLTRLTGLMSIRFTVLILARSSGCYRARHGLTRLDPRRPVMVDDSGMPWFCSEFQRVAWSNREAIEVDGTGAIHSLGNSSASQSH